MATDLGENRIATEVTNRGGWVFLTGLLVVVSLLMIATRVTESPLDDSDPAYQRPGLLDLAPLPQPAPRLDGHGYADGTTLVIFERAPRIDRLCTALGGADLVSGDHLVVVVDGSVHATDCGSGVLLASTDLPARFGMRRPRDGGFPVGYAIVDTAGRIRYRTLDPSMIDLFAEMRTMVAAVDDD